MEEVDASQALLRIGTKDSSFRETEGERKHTSSHSFPPGVEGDQQQQDGDQSVAVDRESARAQFHEAMASIPVEDKAAYVEAARRAPNLVEAESNPDLYLEYDSYDPWKAALRVSNYWKTRAEIFGDRAFLPLTITGDGAMSSEDIKVLRTGFSWSYPTRSKVERWYVSFASVGALHPPRLRASSGQR
jgi:hypothetical protein